MTRFRSSKPVDTDLVEDLFAGVFGQSEGEREGKLVGRLARALLTATDRRDLYAFVAEDHGQIIGAICFSRLTFPSDPEVFILSPVAIHGNHQGQGVGQALINHGLGELREAGVEYVTTYGDPAFYTRVGFRPIGQDAIAPPHPLTRPEGWLGQSLAESRIDTIPGNCRCVAALDDPSYW